MMVSNTEVLFHEPLAPRVQGSLAARPDGCWGKGDASADIMFYGGKIRLKAGSLVWNFFTCRVLHSIKLALCLVVQFSGGLCSREYDVGLGTATSIWAVEEVVYQSCSIKGPCAGGTFATCSIAYSRACSVVLPGGCGWKPESGCDRVWALTTPLPAGRSCTWCFSFLGPCVLVIP